MDQITADDIVQSKIKDRLGSKEVYRYSFERLVEKGVNIEKLPYSIRILLENALRNFDGKMVNLDDVNAIAQWPAGVGEKEIPYMPARVVLQDFTGVPLIVDLAAMREAMLKNGGDPEKVNPLIPTDLVIDHSVQVDAYGSPDALDINLQMEYGRNKERYSLIKWAQKAFKDFQVVPPGSGIVHQVNLEFLGKVADIRTVNGEEIAIIDTLVGTDSHTTMINGLGVMGWGVGGIEAEAVMLGQPYYLLLPEVVGFRLTGELPEGATATDLVLTVTEMLRKKGVVGKFVEFYGPGLSKLSLADKATISNMAPEYGATMGFFPVDDATLAYMRLTGRDEDHIDFVRDYAVKTGIFRTDDSPDPTYTDYLELDMSTVQPSIAGPLNPEERVSLKEAKWRALEFQEAHIAQRSKGAEIREVKLEINGKKTTLRDGNVVIAAITSCTNTSNPAVMVGAGLLAKMAVEKGLKVPPYVKTSFAPGSLVVTEYLQNLDLQRYLDKLGFYTVGYGCTTCIGNSGPLLPQIEEVIEKEDLYVTSVLSGNRNFAGRVSPFTRGNFLASPILVVAYALAGKTDIDLTTEPLGKDADGNDVYLKDIWPSQREIRDAVESGISPEMFKKHYSRIMLGDFRWQALDAPKSTLFDWDPNSTYIRNPPFFEDFSLTPEDPQNIIGARVLELLDDKISTDHISPAGAIDEESPAGRYLISHGVEPKDFNTYGSRRGNHEVMMRGTFANVRIKNQLVPGKEGWWTKHIPSNEVMTTFDASRKYIESGVPALVLGAKQYGVGSSRDWAAKGPALLGIKAVFFKSIERIHRSNLIGMGVLPLQFEPNEGWRELGFDGTEEFDILDIDTGLSPKKKLRVIAKRNDGTTKEFQVTARLDTEIEIEYYKYGGILKFVLAQLLKE